MSLVLDQDERVSGWVAGRCNTIAPPTVATIGWERDGELTAGIYFDTMGSNNVFAHIASEGLMPWQLLAAAMGYAYEQLGVDRVTLMVDDNKEACLKFVESLGAEHEATMVRARKGGDVKLYVLWKHNRFWAKLCETGRY